MTLQIADNWYERRQVGSDITVLWEPYVDPLIRCNIWHVRGRDADLLIDTGLGIASLREAAKDLFQHSLHVVATHSHYDHIGGHYEFEKCLAHPLEADAIRHAAEQRFWGLRKQDIPKAWAEAIEGCGYPLPEILVTAIPERGYDIAQYRLRNVPEVSTIEDRDRIDLGDRTFEVIHLPGHSPGSIGLWDAESGVLFSGDAVYDGPLLGDLPESSKGEYIETLERLLDLPVETVHAGHEPSFGRERLQEIIYKYLRSWRDQA